MATEVQAHQDGVNTVQAKDQLANIINAAVSNPDIDADKLLKLYELHERNQKNVAHADFNAAMQLVQQDLPRVVLKNKRNDQTHSNYADLEIVNKAIKPIYSKHGFSIAFSEGTAAAEGEVRVQALLRHVSGHEESHFVDVPLDDKGIKGSVNKTRTHAKGSAFSYGRRYLTLMMFDIATSDDDDGNHASEPQTISAKQMQILERKLGGDTDKLQKFCEYHKLECIADLPASAFEKAVAQVDRSLGKDNG